MKTKNGIDDLNKTENIVLKKYTKYEKYDDMLKYNTLNTENNVTYPKSDNCTNFKCKDKNKVLDLKELEETKQYSSLLNLNNKTEENKNIYSNLSNHTNSNNKNNKETDFQTYYDYNSNTYSQINNKEKQETNVKFNMNSNNSNINNAIESRNISNIYFKSKDVIGIENSMDNSIRDNKNQFMFFKSKIDKMNFDINQLQTKLTSIETKAFQSTSSINDDHCQTEMGYLNNNRNNSYNKEYTSNNNMNSNDYRKENINSISGYSNIKYINTNSTNQLGNQSNTNNYLNEYCINNPLNTDFSTIRNRLNTNNDLAYSNNTLLRNIESTNNYETNVNKNNFLSSNNIDRYAGHNNANNTSNIKDQQEDSKSDNDLDYDYSKSRESVSIMSNKSKTANNTSNTNYQKKAQYDKKYISNCKAINAERYKKINYKNNIDYKISDKILPKSKSTNMINKNSIKKITNTTNTNDLSYLSKVSKSRSRTKLNTDKSSISNNKNHTQLKNNKEDVSKLKSENKELHLRIKELERTIKELNNHKNIKNNELSKIKYSERTTPKAVKKHYTTLNKNKDDNNLFENYSKIDTNNELNLDIPQNKLEAELWRNRAETITYTFQRAVNSLKKDLQENKTYFLNEIKAVKKASISEVHNIKAKYDVLIDKYNINLSKLQKENKDLKTKVDKIQGILVKKKNN